jgi:hypothetical protein
MIFTASEASVAGAPLGAMRMTGAVFLGDGGRWNLLNLTASTGKLLGKYGLTEGQKRKWQIYIF